MSLNLTWRSKALNDPPLEHPRDPNQEYKQRYLGLHLLPSLSRSHPEGTGHACVNTPAHTSKLCPPPWPLLGLRVCTPGLHLLLEGGPEGEVWAHSYFYPELAIFLNFYLFSYLSDSFCTCTITFWINSCHFLSFPCGCPPCLNLLSTLWHIWDPSTLTCGLQMFSSQFVSWSCLWRVWLFCVCAMEV